MRPVRPGPCPPAPSPGRTAPVSRSSRQRPLGCRGEGGSSGPIGATDLVPRRCAEASPGAVATIPGNARTEAGRKLQGEFRDPRRSRGSRPMPDPAGPRRSPPHDNPHRALCSRRPEGRDGQKPFPEIDRSKIGLHRRWDGPKWRAPDADGRSKPPGRSFPCLLTAKSPPRQQAAPPRACAEIARLDGPGRLPATTNHKAF